METGGSPAMSEELERQREVFREDYARETGTPFEYFYCPTLREDEETEVCEGHVVNQRLSDTTRKWVIQRKDVDAFFGEAFEQHFQDAVNVLEKKDINDILFDPALRRRVPIDAFLDGEPVGWYVYQGGKAESHTLLPPLRRGNKELLLVLKADLRAQGSVKRKLAFEVRADFRLVVLVSLLKAAHLTNFRLFRYKYALSKAGEYVGRDILGSFYLRHSDKRASWDSVRKDALDFFKPYRTMVCPVRETDGPLTGTVDDNVIIACMRPGRQMFATGVFVRARSQRFMVIIPSFTSEQGVEDYNEFLTSDEEYFDTKLIWFDAEAHCFRTDTSPHGRVHWPKRDRNDVWGDNPYGRPTK
jgi:hypothetical protein